MSDQRIVLIGFGNMGQALVRGWLARGRPATTIRAVDPLPAAHVQAAELGVRIVDDAASALRSEVADVIVLAVKPNQLAAALDVCRASASVFLSIAAGKTIRQIEERLLPGAAVVRAMPNTPAAIGQGMTVLVPNSVVSEAQRALCADLLGAVGQVAWIDDERHMDAVTAVSGSGPAYVFLLIECLEAAAKDSGLEAALARQLALATVVGAANYADAADADPAELRRRVTSPKGTTQAALDVLMADNGLKKILVDAVRAATARGRELSQD